MVSIPEEVASAVVLRHLPRVLRVGLDLSGRNGGMPAQLIDDASAIRPTFGRAVRAWLGTPYLHYITDEEATGRSRRGSQYRRLAAPRMDPVVTAVGGLRVLDLHAARADLPALREIADATLLLGFSANVEAAAPRVAAAAWAAVDRLSEVGAALKGLSLLSAGVSTDDLTFDDFMEVEGRQYRAPVDADAAVAAKKAWEDALGQALNLIKADASVLALGLAAMGAGRRMDYYADSTLASHALAIGRQETAYVERKAMSAARKKARARAAPTSVADVPARSVQPVKVDEQDRDAEEGFVVVCPELPTTSKTREVTKGYEHVIDKPIPLVRVGNLAPVRTALLAEFPYAVEAVDTLLGELVGKEYVSLPAFLLEGRPGAGKSRLVRRFGELVGVGTLRVDAAADAGSSIAGTERRWWSTEPCRPFMAIARYRHANPIVAVDELDKAPTRTDYGRIWDALLQLIEPENAARYPDPSLQVDIDIRHVSIICLANDSKKLPGPLLDRLRVVHVPEPGPEHLPVLVPSLLSEIARERGLDPRFLEPPDGIELAALRRRWRGGSVRRLRRAVEAVLRAREKLAGGRLH